MMLLVCSKMRLGRREKYAFVFFTMQLGLIIIWSSLIRDPYSSETDDILVFSIAPRRIDYQISMERIAQIRSSTYSSMAEYKWLFLSSYQLYTTMMDRNFFAQYDAAKRHPNIDATLWGIGFDGQFSNIFFDSR